MPDICVKDEAGRAVGSVRYSVGTTRACLYLTNLYV